MSHLAFVLGRQPSAASVLPAVVLELRRAGATTTVHLAGELDDVRSLADADLVVPRALSATALARLRPLEAAGARFCNRLDASLAARDKAVAARLLEQAGVPVPRTSVVDDWAAVESLAQRRSVVVKPVQGSRGQGVVFLASGERRAAPWPGPYLVQDRVDHDGPDRKVYVVGRRMAGVLRRWPPLTLADKTGTAFAPDVGERQVASAAGAALGLEIFGVDLVLGHEGPVVVDVNAFPGFKGVPEAASWLAEHLASAARSEEVQACGS